MRLLSNESVSNQKFVFRQRFDDHLKLTKQSCGGAQIKQVPRTVVIDYIAKVQFKEITQAKRDSSEHRRTNRVVAQYAFAVALESREVPRELTERNPKIPV